jgi:hypothetical protein
MPSVHLLHQGSTPIKLGIILEILTVVAAHPDLIVVGMITVGMVVVERRNLDATQRIKETSFHLGSRVIWGKNKGHSEPTGRTIRQITRSLIR